MFFAGSTPACGVLDICGGEDHRYRSRLEMFQALSSVRHSTHTYARSNTPHTYTRSTIPHTYTRLTIPHTHTHTVNHSTHIYKVNHSTHICHKYTWSTIQHTHTHGQPLHADIHIVNHSRQQHTHTYWVAIRCTSILRMIKNKIYSPYSRLPQGAQDSLLRNSRFL